MIILIPLLRPRRSYELGYRSLYICNWAKGNGELSHFSMNLINVNNLSGYYPSYTILIP